MRPKQTAKTLPPIVMGLDSVELLMEWEKYFDIQIPDPVAQKISTVQNAVDYFSTILDISDDSTILKDKIFEKLQQSISKKLVWQISQ